MNRRGFLGAIAAALVLDPERALWVPGQKKIFLPPAPRIITPMFNVGDVVTFGHEPQRFVVMQAGDPKTGLGATFAFLSGPGLPWGVRFPDKLGIQRWTLARQLYSPAAEAARRASAEAT